MKILSRLTGLSFALALFATGCDQGARIPTETTPPADSRTASAGWTYDISRISPSALLVPESQVERSSSPFASLVVNGSFEERGRPGRQAFRGWSVRDGRTGTWHPQTGTRSPRSGFPVPPPPHGNVAAMTDQYDSGTHILYQDVTIPAGGAELRFDLFIGNRAGEFVTPPTLRHDAGVPNQQFRMDILDPAAPIGSVDAGVLLTVYHTQPGDPLISGYETITASLDAFAGQRIRLRFAQVATQYYFHVGVDYVQVIPREVLPPSCTPVEVLAGNRLPAGTVDLGIPWLAVSVLNIEGFLPRPNARAEDVRIGASWQTGTPAMSFEIGDINGDGRQDIVLRYDIARLLSEGNLSPATRSISIWGQDRGTGTMYCGTTSVNVVP